MAETTGIAWTRSTFNPWIGCTKVSPGCDHCYAEVSRPSQAMKIKWGHGEPRHRTSASLWTHPRKWNRAAALEKETGNVLAQSDWHRPGFWPVFCASLADVFDNEVPQQWRDDLFALIDATPHLTWQLLTKRIGNVNQMLPTTGHFRNAWIGSSMVNQEEIDRDLPKLIAVTRFEKRFISNEPALGPVDYKLAGLALVNWVIVGGESNQGGNKARPFDTNWARSTVRQCRAADVAVFVKQLGSNPQRIGFSGVVPLHFKDRAGADPAEWSEDLRVQEFPT